MSRKDVLTLALRLYIALIVGMFIVNAAFNDDSKGDKDWIAAAKEQK